MMPEADSPPADDTAFLQERLGKGGLVAGSMGWVALLFRLPQYAVVPSPPRLLETSMIAHAVGATIPLAVWAICRTAPRSRRVLHALDAGNMVLAGLAYCVMGRAILQTGHETGLVPPADLIVLLAMSFGALARAMLVPSSGRRTFLICLASSVGFLVLPGGTTSGDPGSALYAKTSSVMVFLNVAMWWTLATGLSTLTSTTIFGLRRQVQAARQLGQYVLEEKIGEGGMGIVHRARHAMLRRPTAVKLLRPERAGAAAIARFEREVRETARLSHPNTVTVFDYGRTPEGIFYYAMELLDGATLDAILAVSGPLPPARVVHTLRQVAAALVEAHEAGLVHRDLKPSNIALCRQGGVLDVAKVLDFGLVRDQSRTPVTEGPITGTPLYIAPETLSGQASPASDFYALGIVAYELLVGEVPFKGKTVLEICAQHLDAPAPSPSEHTRVPLPAGLSDLILRCLEKDPAARPKSARELLRALSAIEVPAWTQDDAAAWWAEHGAAVEARRAEGAGGSTHTLEVDWARR